ncbi:MAG TPA: hypothetical protein VJV96_03560 [Candidatus Angelobacter sp.]|jgi:hypothetical protein|nr:hypothetical protein [Candidatus Angelobacter sp.]
MGLWSVLFEIVKTAATHAAPHVARGAVDIARERMSANKSEPQGPGLLDELNAQLNQVLSHFEQRLATAEQRALAAEESLAGLREDWTRKWTSARIWILGLLCWNVVITGLAIYLLIARK